MLFFVSGPRRGAALPHHPTTIAPTIEQPTGHSDLVPGDPPVPITVWRTARTAADAGRPIGGRLAARLISAYSRPGDEVVDLTDRHVLAAPCAAGGRVHLPAWFTEASSLIIGPATPPTPPMSSSAARRSRRTSPARGVEPEPPELSTWFGDDLTDPDLPTGRSTPDSLPDTPARATVGGGSTGLVVACWPLHEDDAANRVRLAWLLTACGRLLRPGGCLILVVTVPAGAIATPEDFTPLVQAAAGTGLGYLQHIVAVHATLGTDDDNRDDDGDDDAGGGDAFVYHVTDEELLALASTTGSGWNVAHLRVHADLLVFSQTRNPDVVDGVRTGKAAGRRD